jgi:hypothetical protein
MPERTGNLIVFVEDSTGAPLPGVLVAVGTSFTEGGINGARTEVTDDVGVCSMSGFPAGEYIAEFSLKGFTTQVLHHVQIGESLVTQHIWVEMKMAPDGG